ncbi:undecaprenyl-diphosphate phosphatase [Fundicoccus culcitae]|uniref:Undecaprenyl-diphosphatase n=1 Tax=Fundicoccus culcitae TaxID=2969821 RepID=A0ABY5P5D8_9LACT|nr:undecaprenyl-diphosphate phosphatase [Fundicoccus culcitae]UUX33968.1 undecaprenyl-diphosphate phosphatase [Fundicoccus culcitae]
MQNAIDIIELIKIVILGIVQGITEWLPISSTGHMILVDEFITLNSSAEFKEMFFVLVQLGSIFAVILLYFNKLNPFSFKKTKEERKSTWMLWFKVAVASIPVMVFGFALNDYINEYFYNPWVVAVALIAYGIIFIWVENNQTAKHSYTVKTFDELSFRKAFFIGCFQSLAIIPGTSRSGSTIIGALLLGTSRYIATEFSFFLSIPVMFGASFLKLFDFGFNFTQAEFIYLIVGMLVSFIVSVIAIRFLLNYIQRNDFKAFGYYRIALGSIVILYFLFNR